MRKVENVGTSTNTYEQVGESEKRQAKVGQAKASTCTGGRTSACTGASAPRLIVKNFVGYPALDINLVRY